MRKLIKEVHSKQLIPSSEAYRRADEQLSLLYDIVLK
jgi:hypothetical protein